MIVDGKLEADLDPATVIDPSLADLELSAPPEQASDQERSVFLCFSPYDMDWKLTVAFL